MYSQLGNNYTDREVLRLSKKKYKGRPPKISTILEQDIMSYEDKSLFLALMFDQCLDTIVPGILALQSRGEPAFAQFKSKSPLQIIQSELGLLRVTEKFTIPQFQELNSSFKKQIPRGTYRLAEVPGETRELVEQQLLRFKYKSGVKWPSSMYVTLLLFFVRKTIDQNIVQSCTNIDFVNLLVFTSKTKVSVFTVFAFGFYVLSRLLEQFESEFFLYYFAFCLVQIRQANACDWNSDIAITATFKTDYDFEIFTSTAAEASKELIDEFRDRFESQIEPFILLVLNANPGLYVNQSLFQELAASLNIKEFLFQVMKVFQIQ